MLRRNIPAAVAVIMFLYLWQLVCIVGLIPTYMLPSPVMVLEAFIGDLPLLWENSVITLQEAFIGLILGVSVGIVAAVVVIAVVVVIITKKKK